jgi:hypothetical protein
VSRSILALGLVALTAGPAVAQGGPAPYDYDEQDSDQGDQGSYGYVREVEGSASLVQTGSRDRVPAEVNQPLMVGDRLQIPDRSRAEIVLADGNLVRLDGGTDLVLEHLAASPDADDEATVLRLLAGNIQLVVTRESLGDELPRIDTPNATVYPQDFGVYRIATENEDWTDVTVRSGKAEVVTDGGSEIAEADESVVAEGEERAELDVQDAAALDPLERWAKHLDEEYEQADNRYVDDDLRYEAAPLNRNGSWIQVNSQAYWRPRVESGWRPYTHGRWVYTPSGMTWVSYEPWGWVPYHYGSWDLVSGYGWLWRPGRVYAPAWVYWYWGNDYAGWCPIGYYTHYYSARFNSGFRSGLYGYAGGDWGLFADWTFVPTSYFRGYRDGYRDGRHDQWDVRRYAVPRGHGGTLGRGVITTDTRPLTPDTWGDPGRTARVLTDTPRARRIDRDGGRDGQGGLTDVTPFIARRPDLPPTVRTAIVADGGINQIDGTPLRPSTLGRGGDRRGGDRGMRGARVVPQDPQGPRVVPSGPSTPSDRGTRGGAPRPDRGERTGGVVERSGPRVVPSGPRVVPSDRGDRGQGGAPRPDRGNRGSRDSGPRVVPQDEPPADRRRGESDRPTTRRIEPPPARSYGDRDDRNDDRRSGHNRPAYDPPRPTRAPEDSPRVAPRPSEPPPQSRREPEARRAPEDNDRGDRGESSRPAERETEDSPRVDSTPSEPPPQSRPEPEARPAPEDNDRGDRGEHSRPADRPPQRSAPEQRERSIDRGNHGNGGNHGNRANRGSRGNHGNDGNDGGR